jgi:hypothetical protein
LEKGLLGDESRAGRIGKLFGFIAESVFTIIPESRSLWTGFLTAQKAIRHQPKTWLELT